MASYSQYIAKRENVDMQICHELAKIFPPYKAIHCKGLKHKRIIQLHYTLIA